MIDALEGALSEAARRRFEEHMSTCEGCRTFARQIEQTVAVLRMLPREDEPALDGRLLEGEKAVVAGSDGHRRVPSDDLWQLKALIDTGEDIFMTTIVTLQAIEDLGKQPPKVQQLWPEGGHDAEDRMRIWAADPAGHGRPRWTIVAMAATAWCNVLEGFLRGVSATAIDSGAVARVRGAFPEAQIDWSDIPRARDKITAKMLPSTKKKGQHARYVETVFGCTIDADVGQGLRSLISFRNEVTHPRRGRTHDEHRDCPSSAEWVAWAASVRCLAGTVMRALADRLDERRAAGEVVPLFPDGRGNPPSAGA
jgi:hypothetical protein